MPHREPSRFIASVASLITSTRSLYTDHDDPVRTGRALLRTWGGYLDRFLRDRESLGTENRFVDFHFDEFVGNQMRVVDRIYDRFGWELDPQSRTRMEDFLRRERKDKHGVHAYSLEQFGLSAAEFDQRYKRYHEFLRELKAT